MGDLFDELKKAKLISGKKAKKLAHEKRVERKQKGGDRGEDQESARKAEEDRERRKQQAAADRAREKERMELVRAQERRHELLQALTGKRLGKESEGGQRWHFEAESGELPYLPVSGVVAKRLEAGELGIVRDLNESWPAYVLVPRELALAMKREDPAWVRCLNGA